VDKLRRNSIDEDDYTIVDYGWDDHMEGVAQSANPYAVNNWKYYDWEKGWLMADKADKAEETEGS